MGCDKHGDSWQARITESYGCYDSQHLSLAVPALVGVLCLSTMATVYKAFFFENSLEANGLYAKQTSYNELVFHVGRTFLCVVFVAVPRVRLILTLR
ncbi:MAG: hypothetical protein P4M11_03645 [Candidatus Pacebacteria bacterium]|nr:hypothetical protein [Candidatus Paceibacterota bacterium]